MESAAGGSLFELQPVPVAACLQDSVAFCRPFALINDCCLTVEYPADAAVENTATADDADAAAAAATVVAVAVAAESAVVQAHPLRLQQVLINLLSNAIKFSKGAAQGEGSSGQKCVCVSARTMPLSAALAAARGALCADAELPRALPHDADSDSSSSTGTSSREIGSSAAAAKLQAVLYNGASAAGDAAQCGAASIAASAADSCTSQQTEQSATAAADAVDADEQVVVISVTDSGRGIPPSEAHKLFSAFSQLDNQEDCSSHSSSTTSSSSTATASSSSSSSARDSSNYSSHTSSSHSSHKHSVGQPSGTGLGLSLCVSFMHRMGGHMWADNVYSTTSNSSSTSTSSSSSSSACDSPAAAVVCGASFSFFVRQAPAAAASTAATSVSANGDSGTQLVSPEAPKQHKQLLPALSPPPEHAQQLNVLLVDDMKTNLKVDFDAAVTLLCYKLLVTVVAYTVLQAAGYSSGVHCVLRAVLYTALHYITRCCLRDGAHT
jgi:signal transduction histidine kinase